MGAALDLPRDAPVLIWDEVGQAWRRKAGGAHGIGQHFMAKWDDSTKAYACNCGDGGFETATDFERHMRAMERR